MRLNYIIILMKRRIFFASIVILLCLGFLPSTLTAANPHRKQGVAWTKKPNPITGRYTTKANTVFHSIMFSLDGLYYYGDMEVRGFSLKKPYYKNLGVGVSVAYLQPIAGVVNFRYGVSTGWLQGSNAKESDYANAPREFNSFFVRPNFGIEWYPWHEAGFYIYAGFAWNYSHIKYDVYNYFYGSKDCMLPMIPIEIGYSFPISKNWICGIKLAAEQGLVDTKTMNLDGYPHPNDFGVDWRYNKWSDGNFKLGISFTYQWKKCETCRLEY